MAMNSFLERKDKTMIINNLKNEKPKKNPPQTPPTRPKPEPGKENKPDVGRPLPTPLKQ